MPDRPYGLGRRVHHDPRSRAFPARAAAAVHDVAWRHYGPVLDQGSLGSCTGHALVDCLMTRPAYRGTAKLTHDDAVRAYRRATEIDPFPGCLAPGQRVLTWDFRWVPIEKLSPGDRIMGFDEDAGKSSCYRESTILANDTRTKPLYEVVTDRSTVVCSDEHLFVRRNQLHGGVRKWARADSLRPGDRLIFLVEPCEPDDSYEAGWLAGFFDGEGSVDGRRVGAAQRSGAVMDKARRILGAKGYDARLSEKRGDGCYDLRIAGGAPQHLRFLSQFRPERLVANAKRGWDGASTSTRSAPAAIVQSVTSLGLGEIYATKTSTATLIVEGLLSHNSYPPDDTGSDGLDVCRAAVEFGWITGYDHAFGIDHLLGSLMLGPVMVGTSWTETMFSPDSRGRLTVGGTVAGGHEYVITARSGRWLRILNSWGSGWGVGGFAWIRTEDLSALLDADGDCTVPRR